VGPFFPQVVVEACWFLDPVPDLDLFRIQKEKLNLLVLYPYPDLSLGVVPQGVALD